jgi:superfamily II DNA or RNA helicase
MLSLDPLKSAKFYTLSNSYEGIIESHHLLLYVLTDGKNVKFGEIHGSGVGKTPEQAVTDSYNNKRNQFENHYILAFIVIDKKEHKEKDYDDDIRELIHKLYLLDEVPFDALYPGYQEPGYNREALLEFNGADHMEILVSCIKQYCGIQSFFNTKKPFTPRFGQKEAINACVEILEKNNKCLFVGYTGIGKTLLSVAIATQFLTERGGIVLITSPVKDTLLSFEEQIGCDLCLGSNRIQKYSCVTKDNLKKNYFDSLKKRAEEGEIIFILLTAQDLFFEGDDEFDLREKYSYLKGNIDLWCRDEAHKYYVGNRTSNLLNIIQERAVLDMTATPYKIIGNYSDDMIVNRNLMWGLKYRAKTNLPKVLIKSLNTPFSCLSDDLKSEYNLEEGFDPRKMFACSNEEFVYRADLVKFVGLMYDDWKPEKRNAFNVENDTQLSSVSKSVGLVKLPAGQANNSAVNYIPELAKLWNESTPENIHFIDAYQLTKSSVSPKEYVSSLLKKYRRVIILTCEKLMVGTDIPQIGHIILFDKISSADSFEQLIGRSIRPLDGKKSIVLYNMCPGGEIRLTLGEMVNRSAKLSGEEDPKEMFDNISLTEYSSIKDGVLISYEEIQNSLQQHYQSVSRDTIHVSTLYSTFGEFKPSFWDSMNLSKTKKVDDKHHVGMTSLNSVNGAKVFKPNTKSLTEKQKKQEDSIKQEFATLVQNVMVESNWIADSTGNYKLFEILKSESMRDTFPDIQYVIDAARENESFRGKLQEHINDKEKAFKGLPIEEKLDIVYINTSEKASIGLVYTPTDLATKLVESAELKEKLSEIDEDKVSFVVINALNGSIPLMIRNKYPCAEIVCVEYHPHFIKHLKRLGFKVLKFSHQSKKLYVNTQMKFTVLITNPPFNAPKDKTKKGKNGKNTLYIDFINLGLDLLREDGMMIYVTPPSALTKSTIINKPTETLNSLMKSGSVTSIDYTTSSYFPTVGSPICSWVYQNKKSQEKVKVTHTNSEINGLYDPKQIYYLPPAIKSKVEYDLYNKIISNKIGEPLEVIRSDKKRVLDGTIHTFGYPKVQLGGKGRINFYNKDYEFLSSKLGLWLFDYLRRVDSQISQRQINGICIPPDGFNLTEKEKSFIENGQWCNFSKKEDEKQA